MTTDYADYATPQAHATQISVTGVPLLTKSTNIINDVAHNIPFGGGAVTIANNVPVAQIGYEISVTALIAAGSNTLPIITVELVWTDSTTGTTVEHDTWNLPVASSGVGSVHVGTGPTKGNRLTVKLSNNDGAANMTVTTVVNQNSRVYGRDDWRTETFNSIPLATVASHDQQGNVLCAFTSPALAANAAVTRIFAVYAGRVTCYYRSTTGQTGTLAISCLDPQFSTSNVTLALLPIAANANTNVASLALPRTFTQFTLSDTSGVGGNILAAWFIIDEYLS
jgi:hypothetical protein